uniref:Putative syntaxin n=1 Tax=Trypanosoma congolense (strain IL3000) TaxID=1068625 RepID=G0UYK7_TRYCI|nr:putative syntaxin [Trypanosoma congolense IL3000]
MADYLPNSDGLMRATLRETLKRIRRVREKAGCKEEPTHVETTGDPFRDLTVAFIRCVERVKENIKERNEGAVRHGQDRVAIEQSLAIHKDIRNLETLLEEMKQEVDKSRIALEKEGRRKKVRKQRLTLLEREHEAKASQYKECCGALELIKESDFQRIAAASGVDVGQELHVGRKAQLREQLDMLRRPRNGGGGHADPYAGTELQDDTIGGGRLQDNEGTAEAMKSIEANDKKIQNALDVVSKGVSRLHNLALEMGGQIEMQNKRLDSTEQVMTDQLEKLHNLNMRLKKLLKETRPASCFMYFCCILLILSLVSFFLMQFDVI